MAKKNKKDKRKGTIQFKKLNLQKPHLNKEKHVLTYQNSITLKEAANALEVHDYEIIKYFFEKGVRLLVNGTMTKEQIEEFAKKYQITVKELTPLTDEEIAGVLLTTDNEEDLERRSPIVSILGHVDHGKTTLLDVIRKSNLVSKEKGSITQHIGAYVVNHANSTITFIDTPGHEAFIQMRRRGARATDISIIVVAADDGVKAQTIEAIKHAKDAKVSIIVAINKIDKPNIDIENVKSQLANYDLMPEEWGGDIPFVEISAKDNKNINVLLDTIVAVAEMLDLKAMKNKMPSGIVIESHLDPHFGSVATLLVQNGTLMHGDIIVVGHIMGKVRQMVDENLKNKKIAIPSAPIRISGLSDLPHVGDLFIGVKSEKEGKELSTFKKELYLSRKKGLFAKVITQSGNKKVINIIVRGDTQGSLEVIKNMVEKFKLVSQHINILSMHVGKVTQTDLDLAISTKAAIIAFNVGVSNKDILFKIRMSNITYISEQIIYKIKEALEKLILDNADVIIEKQKIGEAEIKKIFVSSKIGKIAGCVLLNGKVTKDATCLLKREDKKTIFEDVKIVSLRRFKEEVEEITNKQDFGIVFENNQDYQIGDTIWFYKLVEAKSTLENLIKKETKHYQDYS